MEFIFGLLVFAAAAALTGFLLFVLVRAAFGNPLGFFERAQLSRYERLVPQIDEATAAGKVQEAFALLRRAFFFSVVRFDERLIERVGTHHFTLLGRVVTNARNNSIRIDSLPLLEDLINSRTQLLKSLFDTVRGRAALASRSASRTAKTPGWAKNEYDKKIADVRDRLRTNERALQSQIDEVFNRIRAHETPADTQYH